MKHQILKRGLFLLLLLLLCAAVTACGDTETPGNEGEGSQGETLSFNESGNGETVPADTEVTLVKSGETEYRVIYGLSAPDVEREAALRIMNQLRSATGATIRVADDYDYKEETTEIVVGNTMYPETRAILEELAFNEYGIFVRGNKIILAGHNAVTTEEAVNAFLSIVKPQVSVEDDKSYSLIATIPIHDVKSLDNWLADIPEFTAGTYAACFDVESDNIRLYYKDVTARSVDPYIELLKADGFAVRQDNALGKHRFVTCVGEKGMVHLTYRGDENSLSITTDPLQTNVMYEAEENYTKVTETTLAVSSLNYSHREVLDGNGMSYVITLEDGRYVIMDGGYAEDANRLYNFLADNNKREDGRIVIAAWFLSHAHTDHVECFQTFAARYGKKVTLEYCITSAYSESMYSTEGSYDGSFLRDTLRSYVKVFEGCKLVKPHTGQIFKFCNMELQVLYTHEDMYPAVLDMGNNASTVLRMTVNGQTVLFTADAEAAVSNLLSKMYGEVLKSDILQVNHHGYSGGTVGFYDYVDPTYTLWTTSQSAFEKRVAGVKYEWVSAAAVTSNKHVYDMVGGAENCFVADGACEIIRFMDDGTLSVTEYTPDDTQRTQA